MKVTNQRVLAAALVAGLVVIVASLFFVAGTSDARDPQSLSDAVAERPNLINKDLISAQIGSVIRLNKYPEKVGLALDKVGMTQAHVQYALVEESQKEVEKLMNLYRPDYGAFVAMDATTGRIISMVSYSRERPDLENLALRATFPAASVFKIVTAGAAIDLNKAAPETIVPFNGANHTLYKKNVHSTQVNRWTRRMTLREAFARSVNTFFGKLGLFYVGPENLQEYAARFMFNQPIPADIPVQTGYARFSADDPWSVVSAASGYTKDNTMSPIQGALIAAAVANDGIMMEPYLIDSLSDEAGQLLYQAQPRQASVVVDPSSADDLRELFRQTVLSGTSRSAFRKTVRRPLYDDIEFGGKTGSLTGSNPMGKCDWFVGYARYQDQRIAVAALTVNERKWRVKSSMLANLFFTHYFKELKQAERYAKAN